MNARITHPAKRILTRLSVSPFRVFAYILHATGLERIYKPRFERHTALFELTDDVVAKLPKYCYTISGAQGDPINLVFAGTEPAIKAAFRQAGWHRANPASPIHILYGLFTALLKRPYHRGPFAPLYVNIALQDLAYQQSERHESYRERHHLRIWRTGIVLSDGKRLWIGAAGRENGMKLTFALPFWTHKLDPNIDAEREFVVRTLEDQGAFMLKHIQMMEPTTKAQKRKNAHGSQYYTDGRALVVEV